MDRRNFFSSILVNNSLTSSALGIQSLEECATGSIEQYSGPWGVRQAAHLLRRTVYGANLSQITEMASLDVGTAVDLLLAELAMPEGPQNYDFESDPNVSVGQSWVNAPFYALNNYQFRSMNAWTAGRMLSGELNLREKMVLFWHNHFPVGDILDARFLYRYNSTLRRFALGNFKQLTKEITVDPAMLRYLNGNQNTRNAPNENYARELLELFTVGKGDLAGPGDYTTFTEADVTAMAKCLTGWRDVGYRSALIGTIGNQFRAGQHDTTQKQLSHRFGGAIIPNAGQDEYANLIDVVFQSPHVALHICRKLYRYFVYYQIDDQVETHIIRPMAEAFEASGFDIKEPLSLLLKSEHFFDIENEGCIIKNPWEFLTNVIVPFNLRPNPDLASTYRFWLAVFQYASLLQMQFYAPPDVAGWKAYYQSPSYYQLWLSSVSIILRQNLTSAILAAGVNTGGIRIDINVLDLINGLPDPFDVNEVLKSIQTMTLPKSFSDNQLAVIKDILIPGLPDYEWTIEYNLYLENPNNVIIRRALEAKIRAMLNYLFKMPEYQLS